MLPSRSLPPVECCLGTKPIQAARLRRERNAFQSPISATKAVATIYGSPLARSFHTHRIQRRRSLVVNNFSARNVGQHRKHIVSEIRRYWLRVLVENHPFIKGVADPMGNSPVNLPVDDHGIEKRAAIMRHDVIQDVHAAGANIDFDFDNMRPIGIGRPLWREIGRMLEAWFSSCVQSRSGQPLRQAREFAEPE